MADLPDRAELLPDQRRRLELAMEARGFASYAERTARDVVIDWAPDRFACDSFACRHVCCVAPTLIEGVPLTLHDLLRLRAGDLLGDVEGTYPPRQVAKSLLSRSKSAIELRALAPSTPKLRKSEGACAHYHRYEHRCTIYPHRPRLCRTFPYELAHGQLPDDDPPVEKVGFSTECSLVSPYGWHARLEAPPSGLEREKLKLPLADEAPRWRRVALAELPDRDRAAIEQCFLRDDEELATMVAVADAPEIFGELGLDGFLDPDG